MAIILEGADNSGKSTLAQKFGLEVKHPGPRPKTWSEENNCLEGQLRDCGLNMVMDRVTCISSQVYTRKLFDKRYMNYLDRMVYTTGCVVIYCRPPTDVILDMSNHEIKPYDTPKHLKDLAENAESYLKAYDLLFASLPHLVYNYLTPDKSLISKALNLVSEPERWKRWMS